MSRPRRALERRHRSTNGSNRSVVIRHVRMLATSATSIDSPRGHLPRDPVGAARRGRSAPAPGGAEPVPAHRRVRVHRRPRGHGAHRPQRQHRVAVRAQAGRPSVFGSILDRSAGTFRLGPAELFAPAGRRYIPGTNILETTWHTSTGWLVVRDALIVGPWSDDRRMRTYRRPPPDDVGRARAGARAPMRQRPGRRADELRAGVRLRPDRRGVGVHELRLRRGRGPRR